MKKFLLCAGLILAGTFALVAQTTLDATVIGRLDGHLSAPFNGEKSNFDFGSSSIYSNIEASFGEHVNMVWVAHWAGTLNDSFPFKYTPSYYKNTWTTSFSWTDFAYIDLLCEGWTLRLGKDVVAFGGFEYEPWDWDCFSDCCSLLWNNYTSYRWGGSLFYTTQNEAHTFQLQAVSSANPLDYFEADPDTERPNYWGPWQYGYGSYALKYSGEFSGGGSSLFHTSDSFGYIQDDKKGGRLFALLSLGVDFSDKVSASIEGMGRFATGSAKYDLYKGNSFKTFAECKYRPTEKFELDARVGMDNVGICSEMLNWIGEEDTHFNYVFGGLTAIYCPINGNTDFQIKANISSTSYVKGICATLGITYNHCFHIIK